MNKTSEGHASAQRILKDVAELKRLAEAATPGPWKVSHESSLTFGATREAGMYPVGFVYGPSFAERSELGRRALNTAAYIAAANPAAILELLAQRDELLKALEALVDHPEDIMPSRLWDDARAAIAKVTP